MQNPSIFRDRTTQLDVIMPFCDGEKMPSSEGENDKFSGVRYIFSIASSYEELLLIIVFIPEKNMFFQSNLGLFRPGERRRTCAWFLIRFYNINTFLPNVD